MIRKNNYTITCEVCNNKKRESETIPISLLNNSLVETIKKEHPSISSKGYICLTDLRHYRKEHIKDILEQEKGQLTSIEEDVVNSLKDHELLSKNINKEFEKDLSLGEKIADKVAEFGGSWKFIISFGVILISWILLNSILLTRKSFDPYPFILLNLVLSCLAAIQAPIIMMSQNRQEEKDRLRAEHDYQVNLKAELEIRHLNEKVDYIIHQWINLMETQDIQLDILQEISNDDSAKKDTH